MSELSFASVLRISDEKTMQLIELYSAEDCLWNTDAEDYRNRKKRNLSAEKIAIILDLPNFTAKHVVRKFKNLRNSYSQEQKKIAHSIASGMTGDEVYVPKVFWYSKMDSFIRPHVQGKEAPMCRVEDGIEDWIPGGQPEPDPLDRRRKRPRLHPDGESTAGPQVDERRSVSRALKEIQSHLQELVSRHEDHHDAFGKYVASLLRRLPGAEAAALQPRILSLIVGGGGRGPLSDAQSVLGDDSEDSGDDDH